MKNRKQEIRGAVTEHWMEKRLRLHLPINLSDNIIRIPAEALVKMNKLRNELLGTDISLHELSQMNDDEK